MQAKILAALLNEIRPRWAIQSMLKALEKNAQHPARFADIASAAVAAARDPSVNTPTLFFTDTRFWPEEIKHKLPKPPECPDHVGQAARNCSSCWADVKCEDRPADMIGKRYQPPPTLYDQLKNSPEVLALAGASTISTEET